MSDVQVAQSVSTIDTQSASFKQIGLRALSASFNKLFDVVRVGHERGAKDMSLTEIRDLYEQIHSERIDLNRVSARVSGLIAAQRLHRTVDTRACSVSGRNVHPVFIPLKQTRLCV